MDSALTDKMCRHERLSFASGGYYVICSGCSQRWTGNDWETQEKTPMLSGEDVRVPRPVIHFACQHVAPGNCQLVILCNACCELGVQEQKRVDDITRLPGSNYSQAKGN